jgi:hypothetical protein
VIEGEAGERRERSDPGPGVGIAETGRRKLVENPIVGLDGGRRQGDRPGRLRQTAVKVDAGVEHDDVVVAPGHEHPV